MKYTLNRSKFLEPNELLELQQKLCLDNRDDVIVALAMESGARAQEVLNLRTTDLFDDTNTILIRSLKGGRDREIPLRPELYTAVKRFIPFGIKYRRLEQIWRKYNISKKFHSLRHTFAVNLYKRTRDLKLVQLALGHSSPVATAIYTDFVYSQEEMKRILS